MRPTRARLPLIACLAVLPAAAGLSLTQTLPTRAADVGLSASNSPTTDGSVRDERRSKVRPPQVVWRPIPFGSRRKHEMSAYSKRHYGHSTYRLIDPRVIVEHYTGNQSFSATYKIFARDDADPELHELPNVCTHFVIDRDGTIYQLVSLAYMCRHTVGLNYTSVGIEHVGTSDAQILHDRPQLKASLQLTRWLRCRFGIYVRDVIGHNESLSSPYHKERVARLRHQTHPDWTHADMRVYRRKLRRLGGCYQARKATG